MGNDAVSLSGVKTSVHRWLTGRGVSDTTVLDELFNSMQLKSLAAADFLVRAGDSTRYIYLVDNGLLRLFYTTSDGRERNKGFFGVGQLTGAVSAAISGGPAPFSIQALEPCELVQMDYTELVAYSQRDNPTSRLLIDLLAEAFIRNEQREAMLLTLNAEQRYLWLLEQEPQLIQRLPQFHIASYIGVDAVSLSRIRRKLKSQGHSDPSA